MGHCHDEIEGKALSPESVQRVRELLDPSTKTGRVCLRMLDQGETIGRACVAEGTDPQTVMAEWHQLTDDNDILSVEGRRPCISTLETACKTRWATAEQGAWVPMDAGMQPFPLTQPRMGR